MVLRAFPVFPTPLVFLSPPLGFGVFPLWLKDVEDQKMALSLLMSLSGQDSLILLPGFTATFFWAPGLVPPLWPFSFWASPCWVFPPSLHRHSLREAGVFRFGKVSGVRLRFDGT